MNVDGLLKHHKALTTAALATMAHKNHDYAGGKGESPFKNFTMASTLGLCSVEQGILVRMTDKLSRLVTYSEGEEAQVSDESFDDTVVDLINYTIILSAYRQTKGR